MGRAPVTMMTKQWAIAANQALFKDERVVQVAPGRLKVKLLSLYFAVSLSQVKNSPIREAQARY